MKTLIILAILLLSSPVSAQDDPNSTGIWFDPLFDGRGGFIYERGDKHFLGWFTHTRKCNHREYFDSIAALDGELVNEKDYDRCRYSGYKRVQQWFITELCPMYLGQSICPIYTTIPYDDAPLGAPLGKVIDIGQAFINEDGCGFSMLVQYVPNPVLEPDADIYHERFLLGSYIFGPSFTNPNCDEEG